MRVLELEKSGAKLTDSTDQYKLRNPEAKVSRKNKAVFVSKSPVRRRQRGQYSTVQDDADTAVLKGETEMKTLLTDGGSSEEKQQQDASSARRKPDGLN